jgi:hypothetical protein
MNQKNPNALGVPLPRNMREADEMGYLPRACVSDDLESKFISENEMIVTGLSYGFDVDDNLKDEDGRTQLPDFKVRFTAHFKFGPIEPGK